MGNAFENRVLESSLYIISWRDHILVLDFWLVFAPSLHLGFLMKLLSSFVLVKSFTKLSLKWRLCMITLCITFANFVHILFCEMGTKNFHLKFLQKKLYVKPLGKAFELSPSFMKMLK